jgi:chemotaxis response regulator CheB
MWDSDPRLCPTCGDEFLKVIFLTAPMVNEKASRIDQLIKHELDARGISNLQTGGKEGERAKITYKTAPETLAAEKIERDFPQMKDRGAMAAAEQAAKAKWGNLDVKSVIGAGIGGNDALRSAIPIGTRNLNGKTVIMPSTEPNQFKLNDSKMVQRVVRKDPENLQVKR